METAKIAYGTAVPPTRFFSRKNNPRHLEKFQRQGIFAEPPAETVYRRATSVEDLEGAYRLVHDVFVEKKFILPRQSGMRIRIFETSSDLAMFVGKNDGRVVGTIGLIVDSEDMGLPSDRVFGSELDGLRKSGKTVCEVTNLAILRQYRKGPMCAELMRCVVSQALAAQCSYMTCSVSPQQRAFYEFVGFYQIGTERGYSDEVDDPVVSLCLDLDRLRDLWQDTQSASDPMNVFWKKFCLDNNPYLESIPDWNGQAQDTFSNAEAVSNLFRKCGDFFGECTDEQLELIRRRLGDSFDSVYREACPGNSHPGDRILPDGALRIARHAHLCKKSRFATRTRGTLCSVKELTGTFANSTELFRCSDSKMNGALEIENHRVLRE